jgi:hypothetical protein
LRRPRACRERRVLDAAPKAFLSVRQEYDYRVAFTVLKLDSDGIRTCGANVCDHGNGTQAVTIVREPRHKHGYNLGAKRWCVSLRDTSHQMRFPLPRDFSTVRKELSALVKHLLSERK